MRLARLATPVFEGNMVKPFVLGKANVLREGKDVAIFATGLMVNESLLAADELAKDGIDAAVINVHTIKPLSLIHIFLLLGIEHCAHTSIRRGKKEETGLFFPPDVCYNMSMEE